MSDEFYGEIRLTDPPFKWMAAICLPNDCNVEFKHFSTRFFAKRWLKKKLQALSERYVYTDGKLTKL